MKKLRRFEDHESYDKFVESCGSDYEEIPMLIVVGNEIKADLMTECKSWKTALKRFDKVFMGLDEDLDGFLGEGFYESVESGYPSAADPGNYAYGIEEVNEGRWYIYVTCHKEEVQEEVKEEVKEEIKMAKKAVITEVTRNENIFTATYESGFTKDVTLETMPGTIRTWIESNAPELLRVAPTAEELAEAEWLEATEEEEIRAATFNLATVVPEVARQLEEVTEIITTFEAPAVVETIEEEAIEETAITVIETEEATEETATTETTTDIIDVAVAITTNVIQAVQTVAPIVGQAVKTVTTNALTVAMWTVDQLSALWFVLSTYLPIYVEKLATLTVWVAWPKTRKAARKATKATVKAVRAIAPKAFGVAKAVAGGILAGSLVAAGAIWTAVKATAKVAKAVVKAVAKEAKAGWSMRSELVEEWKAA